VTIPPATFVLPNVDPSDARRRVEASGPADGNVPPTRSASVPAGREPGLPEGEQRRPTEGDADRDARGHARPRSTRPSPSSRRSSRAVRRRDRARRGRRRTRRVPADRRPRRVDPVDPDPKTLVGQPSRPTTCAVGDRLGRSRSIRRPVNSIAEARLADEVGADHRLVDGSVDITVGKGSVGEDGQITFEATARATRGRGSSTRRRCANS
jgi:hypothetical protein